MVMIMMNLEGAHLRYWVFIPGLDKLLPDAHCPGANICEENDTAERFCINAK